MPGRDSNLTELMHEWLKKSVSQSGVQQQGSESKPLGKNGTLAIVNGELVMEKPGPGGKWPTITSSKDGRVGVLYKGKPAERPIVVEDVRDIDFQITQEPPHSSFHVSVSKDNMEVWLKIESAAGIEYDLNDSGPVEDLIAAAREVYRYPPEPIVETEVFAEAERQGIKAELYAEQVVLACARGSSCRTLIGVGIPPKPPVDGRIELACDLKATKILIEDSDRVDLLDRGRINSVEAGEVLGYWHPPVEGKPGTDVFGRTIEPRKPKHASFLVGSGVRLISGGTIAVADIAGRPCFERGRLCVRPELVIYSDVDVGTGNIEFTGDVIVTGNVTESLSVRAGGLAEIKGSVHHANLTAGSSVFIQKNLIGGRVSAGGEIVNHMKIVALLRRIIPEIQSLQKAFLQVRAQPCFSIDDLRLRGDGYLLKLILEMRFANIPNLCQSLQKLLPTGDGVGSKSDLAEVWDILHLASERFVGANPLNIKCVTELDTCLACLEKVCSYLDDFFSTPADIKVYYCQNATLEATGSIVVTGPSVYGCTMTAGSHITITGSCRGGSYFAASSITVNSAGLNETVKTFLSVDEGGVIRARTLHPGTYLAIGRAKLGISEKRRNIELRFEDGRWTQEEWR
ncbi:MAG: DUF342 domain-containing protein [Firmicutes bacterium]|nr:DUF342 domain-containing protein [Bacillota bacterium]